VSINNPSLSADAEVTSRHIADDTSNMYNPDQTSFMNPGLANETDTGFVGFLQPKYLNGTWGFQDPIFCSPLLNFTSCSIPSTCRKTWPV
jgi:hypothetical protein